MVEKANDPIEHLSAGSIWPIDHTYYEDLTSAHGVADELTHIGQVSDTHIWTAAFAKTEVYLDDPSSTVVPIIDGVAVPIHFPAIEATRRPSLHALQEWEGWVVEIGEDEFLARLVDVTAGATVSEPEWIEEEEALIPFSEIDEDDLKQLREGSIFRWVIGYERSPSGTKRRVSDIVFRDLPAVTARDLALGEEWANRVSQLFQD